MDIIKAHDLCTGHKQLVLGSKMCGCFYCVRIYSPTEIKEWEDSDTTAVCPYCKIDAVLPENEGYSLDKKFLEEMREHWFNSIFKSND